MINYLAHTNNSLHTIRAFFERAYSVPNLLQNYFNAEKAQSPLVVSLRRRGIQYLRSNLLKANGSLKRMIARFAFPKMPH